MRSLVEYLGCGVYYLDSGGDHGDFIVTRFSDVTDKILPFLEKYPIVGVKAKDFEGFCKAAEIMKVKGDTTESGLEEIHLIKDRFAQGMDK